MRWAHGRPVRLSVRPRHLPPPGGTWNSATANCDCDDGYERSDDGRSCVCADDGAAQTGYRASVLFPNPQSLFDGLRVGFVNTSSGNLTFRRRDIVTRAQGPVVFARVYDSRIAANYDFGPGWRLSLAEELLVDGDTAVYVDEAGARHTFAQTGTAWAASPPTPRHAATTLSFADVDGIRIAVLADGATVRTFEQADAAGARYVVGLVRTPARELVFDYDGGRLRTVSHDGGTLFDVERDRDGRIAAVRDDHGRSVRYAYDADGRLETVRDIAGSDWRHLYRDDGLLGGAVDPEGRTYLAAAYDAEGRVVRAFGGRLHDYAYAPEGTTVAEATGEVHTLTRAAAGVTPERRIGYAYGGHGRVATMTVADSVSGTTRVHSYDYDAQGRLTAVAGGGADATVTYAAGSVRIDDGGEVFEYEVDDRGRVASVRRGADPEIRVERDGAGDVVTVSQGHRSVRFGRGSLGRIVDVAFADGSSARYFYDELGSRQLTEHGDGRVIEYVHDAAGSLASVETTERDGTVRLETASAGTDSVERLVPAEPMALDAEYNVPNSRPARAVGSGTPGTAESQMNKREVYRLDESELRAADGQLAVLMGERGLNTGQHYVGVWLGSGRQPVVESPMVARVPLLGDALALLEFAPLSLGGSHASLTKLSGDTATAYEFERWSEPLFRAAEYGAELLRNRILGTSRRTTDNCDAGSDDRDFKATVAEVDACMRQASDDVSTITPHEFRYEDLDRALGQAATQGDLHITTLDIEAIKSDATRNRYSVREAVHRVLAHEYIHHLNPDWAEGELFERAVTRLRRETRSCD